MEKFLFLDDYSGMSYDDVVNDVVYSYHVEKHEIERYFILIAEVNGDGYEESSYFLLLEKSSGELYEVHGGHCSCYGFEGQFEPEKVELLYLLSDHSYFGSNEEMKKIIQGFLVKKVRYLKLKELFKDEEV
jgi:hypothetical protein